MFKKQKIHKVQSKTGKKEVKRKNNIYFKDIEECKIR